MKGFTREDSRFSLCGLNCGLEHGAPAYCFQCGEFPCGHYGGPGEYDVFLPRRNQLADLEKARTAGPERYHAELAERRDILVFFLGRCNDGRQKPASAWRRTCCPCRPSGRCGGRPGPWRSCPRGSGAPGSPPCFKRRRSGRASS